MSKQISFQQAPYLRQRAQAMHRGHRSDTCVFQRETEICSWCFYALRVQAKIIPAAHLSVYRAEVWIFKLISGSLAQTLSRAIRFRCCPTWWPTLTGGSTRSVLDETAGDDWTRDMMHVQVTKQIQSLTQNRILVQVIMISCSILLGAFFVHWNSDFVILWSPSSAISPAAIEASLCTSSDPELVADQRAHQEIRSLLSQTATSPANVLGLARPARRSVTRRLRDQDRHEPAQRHVVRRCNIQ